MSNPQDRPGYPFVFPFHQLVEDFWYNFVYYPTTNWERAFSPQFQPQFFFGSNVQDVEVERHVLKEVGSYGSQLGQILDVLSILVARLPQDELTPREREVLAEFHQLCEDVDRAVEAKTGPRQKGMTRADLNHMVDELQALQQSDPQIYQRYVQVLQTALSPDGTRALSGGDEAAS